MKTLIEIKDHGFTVFKADDEEFRIVQLSDDQFIIEKNFKTVKTKGLLWVESETEVWKWERVSKYNQRIISTRVSYPLIHIGNSEDLVSYDTFQEAFKWIEDYCKYPIYH